MNKIEERIVWVTDKEGRYFLCRIKNYLDKNRKTPYKLEELSMSERASCRDVDKILGIEP